MLAEEPEKPDLVIDNDGPLNVADAVNRILAVCDGRGGEVPPDATRVVAFKTKVQNLWKFWHLCYGTVAFCHRFGSLFAIFSVMLTRCWPPLPLRRGGIAGSLCEVVRSGERGRHRV